MYKTLSIQKTALILIAILVVQFLLLYIFGQPGICECGFIKLWEQDVFSSGMSQHISDWYTFSHIIHGFIFYGVLWLLFPKMPVTWRLLIAVSVEVAWEVAENTPMVIEAYRKQALAQGYVGDSILNSIADTFSAILGFIMAWRLPIWLIVVLALLMEIFVAFIIHDNLFLNVLNFIYQFDAINAWQASIIPPTL